MSNKCLIRALLSFCLLATISVLTVFAADEPTVMPGASNTNHLNGVYLDSADKQNNPALLGTKTVRLNTGSYYSGHWTSVPDGEGVLVLEGIGQYSGHFSEGHREGTGTFIWLDGNIYEGWWSKDEINGNGKLTFNNGDTISGTFVSGQLIDGYYIKTLKIGNYTIGTIIYKILNGTTIEEAELRLQDGTIYQGPIKNGKFNGNCTIHYANGDTYQGNLTNNKKSNWGIYAWKDGGYYTGDWSNDAMNGSGTYFYKSEDNAYKFTGTFKNSLPHGICLYYKTDTQYYKTQWSNGVCTKVE